MNIIKASLLLDSDDKFNCESKGCCLLSRHNKDFNLVGWVV